MNLKRKLQDLSVLILAIFAFYCISVGKVEGSVFFLLAICILQEMRLLEMRKDVYKLFYGELEQQ